MTVELKPCPWCGEVPSYERGKYIEWVADHYCNVIRLPLSINVETWNARAERTCRNLADGDSYDFECSECGLLWVLSNLDTPAENGVYFCPHCRARIKED